MSFFLDLRKKISSLYYIFLFLLHIIMQRGCYNLLEWRSWLRNYRYDYRKFIHLLRIFSNRRPTFEFVRS